MPQTSSREQQRAFTLVELLLALALSAIIATLAYAGVSSGINASEAMERETRTIVDLQRAFNLLEEDLIQVRLRAVNHGVGYREAALRGGVGEDVLMELTRGGLANPLRQQRSELLRVRYVLRGQQLWRQHWFNLDRLNAVAEPQEVMLLDDVRAVHVRFLSPLLQNQDVAALAFGDDSYLWGDHWNSDDTQTALTGALPLAVRIDIDISGLGSVQRVYELPSP